MNMIKPRFILAAIIALAALFGFKTVVGIVVSALIVTIIYMSFKLEPEPEPKKRRSKEETEKKEDFFNIDIPLDTIGYKLRNKNSAYVRVTFAEDVILPSLISKFLGVSKKKRRRIKVSLSERIFNSLLEEEPPLLKTFEKILKNSKKVKDGYELMINADKKTIEELWLLGPIKERSKNWEISIPSGENIVIVNDDTLLFNVKDVEKTLKDLAKKLSTPIERYE